MAPKKNTRKGPKRAAKAATRSRANKKRKSTPPTQCSAARSTAKKKPTKAKAPKRLPTRSTTKPRKEWFQDWFKAYERRNAPEAKPRGAGYSIAMEMVNGCDDLATEVTANVQVLINIAGYHLARTKALNHNIGNYEQFAEAADALLADPEVITRACYKPQLPVWAEQYTQEEYTDASDLVRGYIMGLGTRTNNTDHIVTEVIANVVTRLQESGGPWGRPIATYEGFRNTANASLTREATDRFRRERKHQRNRDQLPDDPEAVGAGDSSSPDRAAESDEVCRRVRKVIAALSTEEQELLLLHAEYGLTFKEAAEELASTVPTTTGRWYRLLKYLGEQLADLNPYPTETEPPDAELNE
jgi:RNA polymerase sigma factor (sigma-70 family)